MASLLLRENNIWYVIWNFRGKKKFQSTKIRHDGHMKNGEPVPPAEARRALRQLENALEEGRNPQRKRLEDLLQMVEKEYAVKGNKSVASLNSRLKRIRFHFGNIWAHQITELDFLDYAAWRQRTEKAANKTITNELDVVMHALRLGKIQPLPEFENLPAPPPREGFFDDAMIAAMTARLPVYLRGPAWFGYYTGWRREEIFPLEWTAVFFNEGEIRLWTSKNTKPRVFPMDAVPGLRALLEELYAQREEWQKQGHIVPWVFARHRKGPDTVRRMVDFRKAWDAACNLASCGGMVYHDLRRSAARNLELAGWPRSTIMEWMGHETESMFHRYRIVSAADRAMVEARLQAMARLKAAEAETGRNGLAAAEAGSNLVANRPVLRAKVLKMK